MSIGKDALEALLKYHDDKYYNQDNPEISDEQYDALKKSYVDLYGEYNYVPGEATANLKKYEHTTNVSSLDKVQITEVNKVKEHIHRLWPVIIQDKMDGLTVVTYPDEDVTRGNGSVGEVITDKMKYVDGTGNRIGFPIRSEVVMLKSEFNKINEERIANGEEPFKNTRNAAAGMLRQLDPSKVKGLKAFAYNIIYEEERNDSYAQILSLNTWNWNTVNTYIPETEEDALNYILEYEEKYRKSLDFDIDGLVIKHNGGKDFGYTGHHPKGAVAVKFEAKGEWTTLNRIVWQVGRTGKITPVAEFEPIDLEGSTITRATLHNYGIIEALGLTEMFYRGKYDPISRILVVKANDVIPAVIAVKRPAETSNIYVKMINEPKECPVCKGEVNKINDQLFCINPSCESKITGRLVHLAQKDAFNIEGLSEETAKKLIAKYRSILETVLHQMDMAEEAGELVEDYDMLSNKLNTMHPSFIYDLSLDDLKTLPGFAEKSATKLYNEIRNSLTIPFNKFLYGCGIPLIGRSISKDIAEFYYDKPGSSEFYAFLLDYNNDFKLLRQMNGIGTEMINSLKNNLDTMLDPFGYYDFEITDIIPKKKASNQLTFVITGEFDIPRKDIKGMIEDAGHKVSGSVSSKTNYLLAAPGEEGTTKYKKAISLNTPIINSIENLKEIL